MAFQSHECELQTTAPIKPKVILSAVSAGRNSGGYAS